MFILRFIGRILSIGFILFIVFVVSGKGARADCESGTGTVAVGHDAVLKVEGSAAAEPAAGFSD